MGHHVNAAQPPAPALAPHGVSDYHRYHRLARVHRFGPYTWWRPVAELAILGALSTGLMMAWMFLVGGVLHVADYPVPGGGDLFDLDDGDPAAQLMLYGGLAAMLPAPFLAARITGRRLRALWSVANRFRWNLFGKAAAVIVAYWTVMTLTDATIASSATGPNPHPLNETLIVSILVLVVCLPLQCAAEEAIFRGAFPQIFGAWIRSPWLAYIPGIPFFVFGHEYDIYGLIIIAIFSVFCCILVHRTGGLEVAIAFHIGNNIAVEYSVFTDTISVDFADRPSLLLTAELSNWILFGILLAVFRKESPQHQHRVLMHYRSQPHPGQHHLSQHPYPGQFQQPVPYPGGPGQQEGRHRRPENQPWEYGWGGGTPRR